MPEANPLLLKQPQQLTKIEAKHGIDADIQEASDVIVGNYGICHANSEQLQAWILWYTEQKKLIEGSK